MTRKFRGKASKAVWGFFWLLIAGLILANYFGGFVELTVWSIIIAAIAMVVLFHCLASLSLASIPIPLAALYYVFQAPLDLPFIAFWTLVLFTVLVTCGMHVLLPRRFSSVKFIHIKVNEGKKCKYSKRNENVGIKADEEADVVIDATDKDENSAAHIKEGEDSNNPYINVSFGYVSRYLHSDCFEYAELNCSFGGMEVYFDNVTLSPKGGEVNVNCSFGSIEIYVPSHWRVIDDMNASLANAEVSRRLQGNDPDAPTLRVTGSVSLGNVEVSRIKD
jgi:predicted membrane protein